VGAGGYCESMTPTPSENRTPWRRALYAAALLLVIAPIAWSQRGFGRGDQYITPNAPYDGRYNFARIRYTQGYAMRWGVDYPRMERNFLVILDNLTTMFVRQPETNVYTLDDPGLAKHTVAWLTEPGYWVPSEAEALGLRNWLKRGGFLIVDDFFWGQQWDVFARAMRMAIPDVRFVRLDASHPIFNSFFRITNLSEMHHPEATSAIAEYYAVFEDNDPSKRMLCIISFNNDIGDYMEWSGEGWFPVNLSNNAYKYATNFIMYGMSH
jgi:hypothetical protein